MCAIPKKANYQKTSGVVENRLYATERSHPDGDTVRFGRDLCRGAGWGARADA
jgi:hypothetical protein